MVPIHDTDVAETRWRQAEWQHYELWEKLEQKFRRRRLLWIAATFLLFLVLSSVPVVIERWPKWTTEGAVSHLGLEIGHLKRDANVSHEAFRIRFLEPGKLDFVVERASSCAGTAWTPVRTGSLVTHGDGYALLSAEQGNELGVPGLVDSFCYDYLAGNDALVKGWALVGFGIVPVKDLTQRRTDRLSLLLLNGPSAEISFD